MLNLSSLNETTVSFRIINICGLFVTEICFNRKMIYAFSLSVFLMSLIIHNLMLEAHSMIMHDVLLLPVLI